MSHTLRVHVKLRRGSGVEWDGKIDWGRGE